MDEQNKKDRIKIILTGIFSLIIIVCIVGYTYSYFVVKDSDNSTITGTVASGDLEIEVNQVSPSASYKNNGLVPQLDSAIASAVKGTTANCVDDNKNTVCHVYEITVTNKSNMSTRLDGKIKLNPESSANLKWALIDNYTEGMSTKPTLTTNANPYSEVVMVENVEFTSYGTESATKKYYLVVWISETGSAQYDTGVYTGEVVFEPTIYTSYVLKKSSKASSDAEPFLGIENIPRNKIHNIEFINTKDAPDGVEGIDVSLVGNGSVLLYSVNYTDDSGNQLYDVKIGTETGTIVASSGYALFSYLTNMKDIDLTNLDTSKVTNMGGMFQKCRSLTSLDVSRFDTVNVTNMSGMFVDCISLTELDVSNFNTSNVINMFMMFAAGINETTALKKIIGMNSEKFDTSKVINMRAMFQNCNSLTELDVSNFDTSKVIDMKNMFNNCSSITSLDVSKFNTSNVTNMNSMFLNCINLTNLNVSSFDTSKVTDMRYMFGSDSDISSQMFLDSIIGIENFDTSNVTNMGSMFQNCSNLTNLDLSRWNTSNVTYMSYMFNNCSKLTSLDVSKFNTSNVTDMVKMFFNCESLTSLNVSSFNTSNVTNMSWMFGECSGLTSLDVSNFNTSNVTDMKGMFYLCTYLTSLDVSNFNTSKVNDMSLMFYNCKKLTDLDLSSFNTEKVTNMAQMFNLCKKLKSIYVSSNFVTIKVTNSSDMFSECTSLVGGNNTPFDSSKIDKEYARIDTASNPGYFTLKSA